MSKYRYEFIYDTEKNFPYLFSLIEYYKKSHIVYPFDTLERSKCKFKEELYIMHNILKLNANEISVICGSSTRTVQVWIDELKIKEPKSKSRTSIYREKIIEEILSFKKNQLNDSKNTIYDIGGDYVIYRFLSKDGEVLYLGSCERKNYIDGSEYYLKQRLQRHFSSSQKHLPVFLYKNIYKIEYHICKSKKEMEQLEGNLILYLKTKKQCIWNGAYPIEFTLKKHELNIEWKLFKNLTKEERETIRLSFD